MNHNEEAPDHLGGLGGMQPADVLKELNRLLAWLQQVDLKNFGSHINVIHVSADAQYVGHIETQYFGGHSQQVNDAPHPSATQENTKVELPAALSTEEWIRRSIALLMTERYGEEPLFNLQNHWQAIYRILVDKGFCRDSDFEGFDAFIRRVMPEEVNKPYKKDSVRNINKTNFNKPFDKWRYDPDDFGTRKPFDRMVAIARRFKDILEENGAVG